jgi:hypothetical protein
MIDQADILPKDLFTTILQSINPTSPFPITKTSTNKGIVRMHLPDPAQDATLWICSIGK